MTVLLLSGEVAYLQRPARGGVDLCSPVIEAGDRVLLGAEEKARAHGLIRPAGRGYEYRVGMRGHVDHQAEVIADATGVVNGRIKVAAAVARLDDSRGGKGNDVGEAGVGGLRAFRYPNRRALEGKRRRGVKGCGEGPAVRREGGVQPRTVRGRRSANTRRIHREINGCAVTQTAAGPGDGDGTTRGCCRSRDVQCRSARACHGSRIETGGRSGGQAAGAEGYASAEAVERADGYRVAGSTTRGHGLG